MNEIITKEQFFIQNKNGDMVLSESAVAEILDFEVKRKEMEKLGKKIKKVLTEGMEEYGIKKVETDDVLITYVEPTESVGLDQKKLKEEHKKVYFDCLKVSERSGYAKITAR